jgi:deoxyuridine 5'-triphosphate nucleotidohydrolase
MRITKNRDVKTPVRGTEKSAGIDFFIPNDFPGTHFLIPGDAVNIPSGIFAEVPKGYALVAMNKSGVATKKHLQVGACVIDEDYQGEIHLHVRNIGQNVEELKPGEKIVQMLLLPVFYDSIEVVESKEVLYNGQVTERGEGAFGSANKEGHEAVS